MDALSSSSGLMLCHQPLPAIHCCQHHTAPELVAAINLVRLAMERKTKFDSYPSKPANRFAGFINQDSS